MQKMNFSPRENLINSPASCTSSGRFFQSSSWYLLMVSMVTIALSLRGLLDRETERQRFFHLGAGRPIWQPAAASHLSAWHSFCGGLPPAPRPRPPSCSCWHYTLTYHIYTLSMYLERTKSIIFLATIGTASITMASTVPQ